MKNNSRVVALLSFVAAVLLLLMPKVSRAQEEHLQLVSPPDVPPPITRTTPATVVVDLTTVEKRGKLADGVEYDFWTFGGSVPGPMIRARVGDTVVLRLHNDAHSKNMHSIDLHAVIGPGGGAAATQTMPGKISEIRFKALTPGFFVYHCATAPVPTHIANGMYGGILIEPEGGMPRVDHEYFIAQGDFYTKGKTGEKGLQAVDPKKIMDERPTYVLFDGQKGVLTGKGALKAKVGETVRLYVANGGPNLVSAFHIIGEQFDKVWVDGALSSEPEKGSQTTLIAPGDSSIVEFTTHVPGTFLIVDHSIERVFDKGALGMIDVSGEPNPDVFAPVKH